VLLLLLLLLQRPWEVKLYEPEANFLGQVHKVGFLSTLSSTAPTLGWKKRWYALPTPPPSPLPHDLTSLWLSPACSRV
jgi:hypothetical protein